MDSLHNIKFSAMAITSFVLIVVGLTGLAFLFTLTQPTLGPRWLFFFLLTLAAAGIALPGVYYLHRRFPSPSPVNVGVILREALWFGIFLDLLAWLQLGRVLTPLRGFLILGGLILIEYFLRFRENSTWQPQERGDE